MAQCKACGAEIIWIETQAGKKMPCDSELVPYQERTRARGKVVTPNGEVRSCLFDPDPKYATGIGYVPHWATCPAQKMFK